MSEWSDWIEHDGNPAPDAQGRYCNVISADGRDECGIVRCAVLAPGKRSTWLWDTLSELEMEQRCVRYRIRKPRGLTILENLIADLHAPTRKVDAQVPWCRVMHLPPASRACGQLPRQSDQRLPGAFRRRTT